MEIVSFAFHRRRMKEHRCAFPEYDIYLKIAQHVDVPKAQHSSAQGANPGF